MRRDVMKPSYGNQNDKLFDELVVGGMRNDEKILAQPKTKVVDNDLMRRVAAMEDELKTVEVKEKIVERFASVEKKTVNDGLSDNLRRYNAEKTETEKGLLAQIPDIVYFVLAVVLLPTIIGTVIVLWAYTASSPKIQKKKSRNSNWEEEKILGGYSYDFDLRMTQP